MGSPFTHPDNGTSKTQPLPEGTNINPKDSRRNIQLAVKGHPKALVIDQSVSPSPNKDQSGSSKDKKIDASDSESSSCFETFNPFDNYMLITERQLVRNLQGFSKVLYAQVVEDNFEKHEEAAASYADLKWNIDDFHATTFKQYENTNAALRNYERIPNRFRTDHVTGLNRTLNNLQELQNVVKDDPTLNKKVL
ncbi:hypothetical protein Tco_0294471 [Tanacetum coccineum]